MKKQISVITLNPRSSHVYADQLQELFGTLAEVKAYSTLDRSVENIGASDLYLVSTDAFEIDEEIRRYVPADGSVVEIQVTYFKTVIQELKRIPKGTRVLFVNITHQMAREAVTQLEQLGVNQLTFIPYGPDVGYIEEMEADLALTPDETDLVPRNMEQVVNIGHRPCTSNTIIEAAIRLGLDELLEEKRFLSYMKSLAVENYSFEQMFLRSRKLESRFDMLMEILDEGMIGVNEKGEIFTCNQKAGRITGVEPKQILGQPGGKIFPYIPFQKCIQERTTCPVQLIRIGTANISMSLVPVMSHGECIGAFATLQPFNKLERRQNELRSQLLHKGYRAKYCFDDVIGRSKAIEKTKELLRRMAMTESPVLLMGETGTGKELLAHAVHQASRRREGPFVAINVAAMPENLLESELFGYEEGAFTGAKRGGRPGLFELTHNGTLFLDEVEGMSPAMQVKLLRVLQEREIMRVGGNQIIHIDVRIVAATNESLDKMVENGSFRRDLYYRLNALPALIPPLRERGEDIFLLIEAFCRRIGGSFTLSEEVRQLLLRYPWPGNVRELRNVVEYLSFTGQERIQVEDLPSTFLRSMRRAEQKSQALAEPNLTQNAGFPLAPGSSSVREPVRKLPAMYDLDGHSDRDAAICLPPACPDRSEEFWFVLGCLYNASQEGIFIGRDMILRMAKKYHIPLSQREVRELLNRMADEGLVKTGRGRGGSRITSFGRLLWEKRPEKNSSLW